MKTAQEILDAFNDLADQVQQPDTAALVRQIGLLFHSRLVDTATDYKSISRDFDAISLELAKRLKEYERIQDEKTAQIIDRLHTFSNRFMAIENKLDELTDLLMQTLELNDNDGSNNTTVD